MQNDVFWDVLLKMAGYQVQPIRKTQMSQARYTAHQKFSTISKRILTLFHNLTLSVNTGGFLTKVRLSSFSPSPVEPGYALLLQTV